MHGADALIWSDLHQTKGKSGILDYVRVHCQFMGWSMVCEFGVHCYLYSSVVPHLSHITQEWFEVIWATGMLSPQQPLLWDNGLVLF